MIILVGNYVDNFLWTTMYNFYIIEKSISTDQSILCIQIGYAMQ